MKTLFAALAAMLTLAATAAFAAEAALDPLAGLKTGKETLETVCTKCHAIDLPLKKNLDRAGWEQLLGVMTSRGAALEPNKRTLLVDYLVVKSSFETKCSKCHAVGNALAAKHTRDEWQATVKRMAAKNPPEFTAEEISLISAYLTLVVGSE